MNPGGIIPGGGGIPGGKPGGGPMNGGLIIGGGPGGARTEMNFIKCFQDYFIILSLCILFPRVMLFP